jgi:hypothetical protein
MKHKIIVKTTLKLEEVSDNDVFVCKTFSHLLLFEIPAAGDVNAETAEHLKGCWSHAGRMLCRRAGDSTMFWTCTGRERGLWEVLMLIQVFSFLAVKSRGT